MQVTIIIINNSQLSMMGKYISRTIIIINIIKYIYLAQGRKILQCTEIKNVVSC